LADVLLPCSIVSYLKDSKVEGAVMVNKDGAAVQ
jgi:hypothetical protein